MHSPRTRRWATALVTGGSAGIGLALSRRLASEGTDLVLVARREHALQSVADELHNVHGVQVRTLAADLSTAEGIEAAAGLITSDEPVIDLVVNNAAAGGRGALVDRAPASLASELAVGVTAPTVLTHHAARHMVRRRSGSILNVASTSGFSAVPYGAAYGASKAYLIRLGEAVHHELRDTGTTVTTVCPGFTDTGAAERTGADPTKVPAVLRMTPDAVAAFALDAVARGTVVAIPGMLNRVGAALGRHLPSRALLAAVAAQQRRLSGGHVAALDRDGEAA